MDKFAMVLSSRQFFQKNERMKSIFLPTLSNSFSSFLEEFEDTKKFWDHYFSLFFLFVFNFLLFWLWILTTHQEFYFHKLYIVIFVTSSWKFYNPTNSKKWLLHETFIHVERGTKMMMMWPIGYSTCQHNLMSDEYKKAAT